MASNDAVVQTERRIEARQEVDEVLDQLVDDSRSLNSRNIAKRTDASSTTVAQILAALREGTTAPWLADRWSVEVWSDNSSPIRYTVYREHEGEADPSARKLYETNSDVASDIADLVDIEYDPDRNDINRHTSFTTLQRREIVAALFEDVESEDLGQFPKAGLSKLAGRVLDEELSADSFWTRSELVALRDGLEDAPLTTAAEAGLDLEEGDR